MARRCYGRDEATGAQLTFRQRTGQTLVMIDALQDNPEGPWAMVVGGQTRSDLAAGFVTFNAVHQLWLGGFAERPRVGERAVLTESGRRLVATLRGVEPLEVPTTTT